jgi:hypothetical protein
VAVGQRGGGDQRGEQDHGGGIEQSFGPGRKGEALAQQRAGEPERERPRGQGEHARHD